MPHIMRIYGLMVFIAALLISPLLHPWMGQTPAILLVILPFALFSAVHYRRAAGRVKIGKQYASTPICG